MGCVPQGQHCLTVDTSGSLLLWGKREQGRQTNSNKEKEIHCVSKWLCLPASTAVQYILYSLNQTWWNDKPLCHTAWRSYAWNKICVTNHDLRYISQDMLLQTFTAHWLWFNFLSMVQCIEIRPILGRGITNLSACNWTPSANRNWMKLSEVITPLITN